MILKDGTSFDQLDSAILFAAIVADDVWKTLGVETGVTLTSGRDGKHSARSLHYPENSPTGLGKAIDIRVWNLPDWKNTAPNAQSMLKKRLNEEYDVILEYKDNGDPSHLHVEHDPG